MRFPQIEQIHKYCNFLHLSLGPGYCYNSFQIWISHYNMIVDMDQPTTQANPQIQTHMKATMS